MLTLAVSLVVWEVGLPVVSQLVEPMEELVELVVVAVFYLMVWQEQQPEQLLLEQERDLNQDAPLP